LWHEGARLAGWLASLLVGWLAGGRPVGPESVDLREGGEEEAEGGEEEAEEALRS